MEEQGYKQFQFISDLVEDGAKPIQKEDILRNMASEQLLKEIGVDVSKFLEKKEEPEKKKAVGGFFAMEGDDEDDLDMKPTPAAMPGLPNPFAMPSLKDFKKPKIDEDHTSSKQIKQKMEGLGDKKKELSEAEKQTFQKMHEERMNRIKKGFEEDGNLLFEKNTVEPMFIAPAEVQELVLESMSSSEDENVNPNNKAKLNTKERIILVPVGKES